MKWPSLTRLDGYLPDKMEQEYRQYYLKHDVRSASISILFLTVLLVIFAYNDFVLFGFVPAFYYLIGLRGIYLIYNIWLLLFLRRNTSPVKFDWHLFVWLILSGIMVTGINLTRPAGYVGNIPIDVVIITIVYLGMPIRLSFRTMGGLLFMLAEAFDLIIWHHASAGAALYTSIIALVMANIIGIFISGRLYSFRRSEFKARAEVEHATALLSETGKMASVGGWELDVKTHVLIATDQVYRIYELEPGRQLTLEDGIKYYAPEAVPIITEAIQHAVIFGEPFDLELPFITAKGNRRWVRAIGKAYSEKGIVTKVGGTFQDITSAKEAEDIIKRKSEQWQTTFDAISDLVSIQDKDFRLVRVNKAFASTFQMRPEELIGKHCYEIVHQSSCPIVNCPHAQAMQCRSGVSEEVYEPRLGLHMEVTCSPIFSEDGELESTVHIVKDITERKKAEEERQKAADRIQDLYNNAPAGYHSLDKDGVYVQINDTELAWIGYTRDEVIGKMKFPDLLTTESRNDFATNFPLFKERGWLKDVEAELIRKDGTTMPVLVSATAIKDVAGNFIMSRTTLFDITEVRKLQKIVAESEKRYRTILEEMNDSYFELDLDGNFTFANNALCRVLLITREEIIGKNFRSLTSVDNVEAVVAEFRRIRDIGEPNRRSVLKIMRKDGIAEFAEISVSPLRDDLGNTIGYRCLGRDITERMEYQNKIAEIAMHDSLTALPNRLLLYDHFNLALAQAQRNNRKLAVMELDLDNFKIINDTYGHAAGDELLKAAAGRLSGIVRKSDTVARLGGDEFVVLMPEISKIKDAVKAAQKIIAAFEKPFLIEGNKHSVTTSIGIAIYPEDGENIEDLIKVADTAMYEIKEHGRNNYKLSDGTKASA